MLLSSIFSSNLDWVPLSGRWTQYTAIQMATDGWTAEVISSIQRSEIPKTSCVQRIAHNNSKVNSQLLGTSTTQQYLTERWKGKCGHQINATYSGSVDGRVTFFFLITNARCRPTVSKYSSWCGLTSGPKRTIYWDFIKFHNKPHFRHTQNATQRMLPLLNSSPHSAPAITMLLRQINELNRHSGKVI